MLIELKVPAAGESITEVTVVEWLKAEGSLAKLDETLAVIETDKANVDLVAPAGGRVQRILKSAGAVAKVGEVIGYLDTSEAASASTPVPASTPAPASAGAEARRAVPPSVRRELREKGADPLLQGAPTLRPAPAAAAELPAPRFGGDRALERVPMTRLRQKIAERLVEAQSTAALLTTFNEIDMGAVMALRAQHQEDFQKKHGVKLGFMSFFVRAVVTALEEQPALNAEIDGSDIVYHRYFDIGVAVGGGRGLVVPVLRDASQLGFAEIEKKIADFGARAKENKLKPDELSGGTFTISNGGVYGSLLSTPIVNPPQSGILGMHAIQDRPIVRDGQVVPAKMMYVALTYDHRLVDGREAVTFLVHIKKQLESPARMLLQI